MVYTEKKREPIWLIIGQRDFHSYTILEEEFATSPFSGNIYFLICPFFLDNLFSSYEYMPLYVLIKSKLLYEWDLLILI